MTSSAQQIRAYKGPAILSFGFRPFFLVAGIWTVVSLTLSTAMLSNHLTLPIAFTVVDWHVHEQLYGYLPAVMAGFLLTAVPNWTGRLPVVGMPLFSLVLVWVIGRLAIYKSVYLGVLPTALLDSAFLLYFAFIIGREVVAGKNWKNLKVLVLVGVMAVGNAIFHYEAANRGAAANGYGARIGLSVAIILIMVVGGRIIPSFTRNWLVRRSSSPSLPAPFARFDVVALVAGGVALVLWVLFPGFTVTCWFCLIAALLQFIRMTRWAVHQTFSERLVLILHVGFAFIPFGFLLVGGAILWPHLLAPSAAVHAWTAGAVGVMTLAVMTRASLGHSGQPLVATRGIEASYLLVVMAAFLRIASGLTIAPDWLIDVAGMAWILGFSLFVFQFAPLLVKSRIKN